MENKELESIKKAEIEKALEEAYDAKLWAIMQACEKAKCIQSNKQKEFDDRTKSLEEAQNTLEESLQLLNEMDKYGK